MDPSPPGAATPLRADAARNHRRIVEAAAEAFESDGPDVPLEEIARRAGLGVATLYRRFRTREALVRAVVEELFAAEVEPTADVDTGDPWADLVGALSRALDVIAGRTVILKLARDSAAYDVDTVHRYGRALGRLLDRARDAGVVRPELTVRDLSAVLIMAITIARHGDPGGADRRRYLGLLTDGLRPAPEPLPPAGPESS
ncbi:TetR/AcrR family transcriptional regulator [Pseudonocardia endophytica]|uniref:TetR family transcriptional regulator n=1 Tax=Pseudonocardia endophytica TaxID=401976 RepID=A0A4R1HQN2_PSEEN|nr:TetR/AcrR family transcriptional regulator [Pseudonocardia endophytica]TCK24877.1 TetR family transcriptional regulator [Pseudonocardia endophytica]